MAKVKAPPKGCSFELKEHYEAIKQLEKDIEDSTKLIEDESNPPSLRATQGTARGKLQIEIVRRRSAYGKMLDAEKAATADAATDELC